MSQIDASPFLEDFFLANTPGYLLRKTLENPRLQDVLGQFSDDDLDEIVKRSDKPNATSSESVAGYVALIALLKRGGQSAVDRFSLRTPVHLKWAPAIVAEWDSARQTITNLSVVHRPVSASMGPVSPTVMQGDTGTSTTTTQLVFDSSQQ